MTREEAIEILKDEAYVLYKDDNPYNRQAFDMAIEALQAQKTGHWIQAEDIPTEYAICTNCKGHGEFYMDYCWHCGARMEREEE